MQLPEGVILLDSLGDLKPGNTSPILVCGSHCGGSPDLARHVKSCSVKAVFLNSAGVGKNHAGTRGLTHYQTEGVLACAVDNMSAEIGVSLETWEYGIISDMSSQAKDIGILVRKNTEAKQVVELLMEYQSTNLDAEKYQNSLPDIK